MACMLISTEARFEEISIAVGSSPSAATGGGEELERLLEAAEWLQSMCPALDGTPAPFASRLRAVVVDLGLGSDIARDRLRSFSDRFPGIAILVHHDAASDEAGPNLGDGERQSLAGVIAAFALARRLSPRQRVILELHLSGQNDKEIAVSLGCEPTTVYEHWRRMARKSGGTAKANVLADFHRCLTRDLLMTNDSPATNDDE